MVAKQKLHGVNLGGWLVLERWLTPSLFDSTSAQDEYSWCLEAGDAKHRRLEQHRKTFITEQDFSLLQARGINGVRIPIGHWIFGDAPPYTGCIQYLDWAVETAAKHNIHVLIDLHAAPGSQNGWQHSGKQGAMQWHLNSAYIKQTIGVLGRLAERYKAAPNLWGIGVLNEPHWDIPKETLARFYESAYERIRQHAPNTAAVVISDSFRPTMWDDVLTGQRYKNIILDSHLYQCFSAEDKALDFASHIAKVQTEWRTIINKVQQTRPMIIGEWSIALSPNTYARCSDTQRRIMKQQYARTQLAAFNHTAGHFYWTYKKEFKDDWDFGI